MIRRPLILALTLPLAASPPDAHWSFDGDSPAERLEEAYGRESLDATQAGGGSSWSPRAGFGEVLANGVNPVYLRVPEQTAIAPEDGDLSISLWLYRTSTDGQAAGILDALGGSGSGYQLFFQSDDTIRLRLDDEQGNFTLTDTASPQLALDTWRHLAVSIDRSAELVRMWIDGSEVDLAGADISGLEGGVTPAQDLFIGSLNGQAEFPANGRIDDLGIFRRLLTADEIDALNAGDGTPVLDLFPPSEPIPAVSIQPDGGILRDGETVTLSSDPGAEIRYTLDGSAPDAGSTPYTAPFPLSGSATVRARVVENGEIGEITGASFIRLPAETPNVLMIVADDLGFNDLGCYGSASTATPNLDALARGGQRFTQFTTTGPGDLAAQYALLTGRLARRGGMPAVASPGAPALDPREWTLAEAFRKSGYHTALIGEWRLGNLPGAAPNDQGFALFHGLPWSNDLAQAPPLVENDTTLDSAPEALTLLEELTTRAESEIAARASDPFFLLFQPPSLPAEGSSLLGDHGDRVEALDTAVGRLLGRLGDSDVADDTLVLFLTDGGAARDTGPYSTGSNGQLRDGAGTTWEGGVRGPMIVRWPGVTPAADNFSILWLPDLFATLADIIDGYVPGDRPIDGGSRPAVLLGEHGRPDEDTTLYLHQHTGSGYELHALRSGGWKLHRETTTRDPENNLGGSAPHLFDLHTDPSERIDRSSSRPGIRSELQQLADAHEATFATAAPQLPPARDAILGPVSGTIARTTETTATFAFDRPADSLDDHYILQTGNDLTGWTDVPAEPYIEVIASDTGTERIEVTVPLETLGGAGPRFFVRLKTARP